MALVIMHHCSEQTSPSTESGTFADLLYDKSQYCHKFWLQGYGGIFIFLANLQTTVES